MKLYRSRSSYGGLGASDAKQRVPWRLCFHRGRAQTPDVPRDSGVWRDPGERSRTKKAVPVMLAFCLVLGMTLPVFLGRVRRVGLAGGETTIRVTAALDGVPWSGHAIFRIGGTQEWSGTLLPYTVIMPVGVYTLSAVRGGPAGAILQGIEPSSSQLGTAGTTITFTLLFASPSDSGS